MGAADRLKGWTIRPYQPGDELAILDLYRRAYRKEPPAGYWEWKFRDNPVGVRGTLGFDPEGVLVAHMGGLPALTKIRDRVLPVLQGADWMIDPACGGLRRGRVLAAVTGLFFASCGNERDGAMIFGVPVPAGGRFLIGAHDQVDFRAVSGLVRTIGPRRAPVSLRFAVGPVALDDPRVDALWERLGGQYEMAVVRDRRHLVWRYAQAPTARYEPLGVFDRWRRRLEALAVLRAEWEGQPFAVLVDWLVPREAPAVGRLLLAACEGRARALGRRQLMAWFPPASPEARLLVGAGYGDLPTPYHLVGSLHTPHLTVEFVREHWYYTAGDTDVF